MPECVQYDGLNVFLVIIYDGVWSVKGFNWVYKGKSSLTLTVTTNTTLEQMRKILYEELEVDSLVYDLKLEICSLYMKGQMVPPEVIKKERQLRTFFEIRAMLNTDLPLFVTKVRKVENLESANPLPGSVVGSFDPETNVGVGVNEEVPTNVDQQQALTRCGRFDEFDAPSNHVEKKPIGRPRGFHVNCKPRFRIKPNRKKS